MSEAVGAVTAHIFAAYPDLPAITATVDPGNTASITLLTKLGFAKTGEVEKNFRIGDQWFDTAYFLLVRPGA